MTGDRTTPGNSRAWSKFWWGNWLADLELRSCSMAARGLWIDMLCVAASGDPYGHLTIAGKPVTTERMAQIAGAPVGAVRKLIDELRQAGVFSETEDGVIYSRRMVREKIASDRGREAGKTGGNPALKGGRSNSDKGEDYPGGLTPPHKPIENRENREKDSVLRTDAPAEPTRAAERGERDRKASRRRSPSRPEPPPDSPEAQAQAAMLAEAMGSSPGADDTPRSRLWRDGLARLARIAGKPAKSMRPLLGKMRDDLAGAPGVDDPDAALLEIIGRADAEQPSEPIPWIAGAIRARFRPQGPCANDDAEAWAGIADGIEFDKRKGRNRPVVAGYFIDGYAADVCLAAGIPHTWRGDWSPLVAWLRDDIDGDGKQNILAAIRRVAARPGYQPPASLAYFDAAVRGPRPVSAAAVNL